ncbi:MAG: DNA alkylation repair protein, partial [Oscillospiraceae bacterium]|nr:DNA alkylation repair protein [Oscillospiraceae bacterium]
ILRLFMEITKRLFELQDLQYKAFQCKLMPTVDPNIVLGVRTPALRQLAKDLYRSGEYAAFLQQLPHRYYEENNLHGFLIGQIKDFDPCRE